MFKNYLKSALRNLLRFKIYSVINILGLAIGMACAILLMLYIDGETSYDSHYANADRTYRITNEITISGKVDRAALVPFPVAKTLLKDFPEVEQAGRFMKQADRASVKHEDQQYIIEQSFFADSTILDLFNYDFVFGDSRTALQEPNSIVITASVADKIFGSDDPIGKLLMFDNASPGQVTGVVRDHPDNTHLKWNSLVSMSTLDTIISKRSRENWLAVTNYTYFRLRDGADPDQLRSKLPDLYTNYIEEIARQFNTDWQFEIMPINDIHLNSDFVWEPSPVGNVMNVYIFLAVAVFILLIASINYMNLATARSAGRAREIGIRKVLGAVRGQLMKQFLLESLFVTAVALVLAFMLAEAALPLFNHLADKAYVIEYTSDPEFMLSVLGMALLVGLLAGIYPALFLSSFRPIAVLKGILAQRSGGSLLRKGLVILQFTISIAMIIGAIIVNSQLNYLKQKELGFKADQLLVVEIPSDTTLRNQMDAVHSTMRSHNGILNTSVSTSIPGRDPIKQLCKIEKDSNLIESVMNLFFVDYDYLDVMGLELAQGRNFDREIRTDSRESFLVNEALVRHYGWDEALGKRIQWGLDVDGSAARDGKVIGVVKDFNVLSLHNPVEPLAIILRPFPTGYFFVRIETDDIQAAVGHVEDTWKQFDQGRPPDYFFMDEYFNRQYQAEEQRATIFLSFTILTILIACLGLFGLSSFTSEQRTKEIGIRKVIGASIGDIVLLLSRDFLRLVLIAIGPAWLLAYFYMNTWLQNFAYRVDVNALPFVVAGIIAVAIALTTVAYQAVKAAVANPVESLKYE